MYRRYSCMHGGFRWYILFLGTDFEERGSCDGVLALSIYGYVGWHVQVLVMG